LEVLAANNVAKVRQEGKHLGIIPVNLTRTRTHTHLSV
jgi:hypothetical protein